MNHLLPTSTAAETEVRHLVHAVLPIGSFEQHGRHLPLITDTVIAETVAGELELAYPVFALPPVTSPAPTSTVPGVRRSACRPHAGQHRQRRL